MTGIEQAPGSRQRIEIDPRENPIDLIIKMSDGDYLVSLDFRKKEEEAKLKVQKAYTKADKREAIAEVKQLGRFFIGSSTSLEGNKAEGSAIGTISSEGLDPQMSRDQSEPLLRDAIRSAVDMDIPLERIIDSLKEVGMNITVGETHIGEVPSMVEGRVGRANRIAKKAYKK